MLDLLTETSIVGLVQSNKQRESEAPLVAIRDMVTKLQADTIPEGVRVEVKLWAGTEKKHNEWSPWVAESL